MLIIGATNRPFDLDEAALRRLTKRIYIGLPDFEARKGQVLKLLKGVTYELNESQLDNLANHTEGFSSADLTAIVKDAAMGPLRDIPASEIAKLDNDNLRAITLADFAKTLKAF